MTGKVQQETRNDEDNDDHKGNEHAGYRSFLFISRNNCSGYDLRPDLTEGCITRSSRHRQLGLFVVPCPAGSGDGKSDKFGPPGLYRNLGDVEHRQPSGRYLGDRQIDHRLGVALVLEGDDEVHIFPRGHVLPPHLVGDAQFDIVALSHRDPDGEPRLPGRILHGGGHYHQAVFLVVGF